MYVFVQCVTGGGGIWLCGKNIQELYTVYLARFRPTELLYHPKQKHRRGGGLRQINTCRQVPLQVNFLKSRHLGELSRLCPETSTILYVHEFDFRSPLLMS
jgi:hypothetical protein